MKYIQYETANEFLGRMTGIFEKTEARNGLMFGICLQLKENSLKYGRQPLFTIVEDDSGIQLAGLMTPPHKLILCAAGNVSRECVGTLVQGLLEHSWRIPAILAEERLANLFAEAWTKSQSCLAREGMKEAVHELRTVQSIKYASGKIRKAAPEDIDMAKLWGRKFHKDCFGDEKPNESARLVEEKISAGELFFWVDSMPVSMAVETRPTPRGKSVGLVYTPPEFRGRGYATSLVASLSQRILDGGKQFCCLYTDLANPTSNSIYRKIGYIPVANLIDIHFDY